MWTHSKLERYSPRHSALGYSPLSNSVPVAKTSNDVVGVYLKQLNDADLGFSI